MTLVKRNLSNYKNIVVSFKYTTKCLLSYIKALVLEKKNAFCLMKKLRIENLFSAKPVADWRKFII